jgi:hypothetical protein
MGLFYRNFCAAAEPEFEQRNTLHKLFLKIWISFPLPGLNPDPYWECGSGYGGKDLIKTYLQITFQRGFCTYVVKFYDLIHT